MPTREFLQRHRRVALDTNVLIYQVERNVRYVSLTRHVFAWITQHNHTAVTSTITMTELLVHPYRYANQQKANAFYALLSTYPNLEWVAPSLEISDTAAKLRAEHQLRTPDALQAATALHAQATGFVTNDPVFQKVEAFETIVLDHLL